MSTEHRDLDYFLRLDPRKMNYAEYLRWYARARDLQAKFSLPIVPLEMFQSAFQEPASKSK